MNDQVPRGNNPNCALFPVVLKVPEFIRELPLPRRVKALGGLARESVFLSARRAGLSMEQFLKGDRGQPLPLCGVHWSLTHKPLYVAGVVSVCPVGIDIECMKPVSAGVFARICRKEEVVLFQGLSRETVFFKCFTAKEAVLKRHGLGLTALGSVWVRQVSDAGHLDVSCENTYTRVEQFVVDDHLLSITGDGADVIWTMMHMDARGQYASGSFK
jgi:4'-phosphopantetheinyl transferase